MITSSKIVIVILADIQVDEFIHRPLIETLNFMNRITNYLVNLK